MNNQKSFTKSLQPLKRLKLLLKKKAGWLGVPKIILYRGFGNEKEAWISGRVIEDSGLAKPEDAQRVWQNFLATIKRYSSDAYIGVRVEARYRNQVKEIITDEYGFFSFHFHWEEHEDLDNAETWRTIQFTLLDQVVDKQPETTAEGEVRVICTRQERIIVSDIDDTVMVSHSTRLIKKLRLMFFKNAYSRLTFEGAPGFYKALERGKSGTESHPLFFVSSSEWNLYDLLDDFFIFNEIPKGILLLQRFSKARLRFWKSEPGAHLHKLDKIRKLMEVYEHQDFILIGDSGQSDLAIYQQLASIYPQRIDAIYIRELNPNKADSNIQSQVYEFGDSFLAMEHARKYGYIQ